MEIFRIIPFVDRSGRPVYWSVHLWQGTTYVMEGRIPTTHSDLYHAIDVSAPAGAVRSENTRYTLVLGVAYKSRVMPFAVYSDQSYADIAIRLSTYVDNKSDDVDQLQQWMEYLHQSSRSFV